MDRTDDLDTGTISALYKSIGRLAANCAIVQPTY